MSEYHSFVEESRWFLIRDMAFSIGVDGTCIRLLTAPVRAAGQMDSSDRTTECRVGAVSMAKAHRDRCRP
jgi:hypothetical protein